MSTRTTKITQKSIEGNNNYTTAEGDPFIGEQETTDSVAEAVRTPDYEMVLERPPAGEAVKSRKVAGVLGVFLGGFGAHRFYLGYWVIACWQIAVTLGAFFVALIIAKATGSTWFDATNVAFGAAALGIGWGFLEGLAIALGGLSHDAMGRPLRS